MTTSFPRQYARTQRFTRGAPRAFTVSPDGSRVVLLRSGGGSDRANRLWVRGSSDGREYVAADPEELLQGAEEELSAEERARRERSREGSGGIVAYATDKDVTLAAFALSGRLFTADLWAGTSRELHVPAPVVDPRPSPDGRYVAYVSGGALRVVRTDGGGDHAVAEPSDDRITYGLAEFIAAEEMDRSRGHWWSPDGENLLVARVDESPVQRWWIADPAHPDREPAAVAYPAAGTPNADVTLFLMPAEGGEGAERREIVWDRDAFPYLARVHWSQGGPPLLLVQARDQRTQRYLTVDTATGATSTLLTEEDANWLELFSGVPAWTPDGRLVRIADTAEARVLFVGEQARTDAALHVRAVLDVGDDGVLFSASPGEKGPEQAGDIGVHFAPYEGGTVRLTAPDAPAPHVASAVRGGDTLVLSTATPDRPGARAFVLRLTDLTGANADSSGSGSDDPNAPTGTGTGTGSPGAGTGTGDTVTSHAERPSLTAAPLLVHAGERRIPTGLVLPTGYRDGDGPLPVLMDPYGGPHGQRVVAAHNAWLTSQWFADQGFAVVVADGRGAPGRSPAWEKAVSRDIADVTLDDQIAALQALAADHPLDLTRVGIRGWSYGGYLAALAVLRRPDVFHSAVAGAPVTDWRLYDTHYTERYCGTPQDDPETYARTSLVTDEGLSGAAAQHRPLMLIHGLADDNVTAAHTLRLSSALLAAGRPHEMLPLSGVTHMTPQEQVTENLLLLQVAFLKRTLGVA